MLSIVSLVLASLCPVFGQDSSGVLKLTILHINDPHAHYVPYQDREAPALIGGFAKASTVLEEVRAKSRAEGRETLFLFAGDLLTGTPYSMVFRGTLGVTLLNAMKLDAMTVGNHEFDYGRENLLTNMKPLMKFPLLSANIRTSDDKSLFDGVLEKKFPGSPTRIMILGLTTQETPITTHPKNVKGLAFDDPIVTAKNLLKGASDTDLVIALTHLGVEQDKKLAEACPRINAIIGGHSHTALSKPIKVNDTVIAQAGAYARYLGKLDLDVKDGKIVRYSGELIPLDAKVKEDPQIAAIIDTHRQQMNSSLEKVIGKTEVFLEGSRFFVRSDRNTDLGRLIGYTLAQSEGADAAIMNGGGIRDSIKQGDITLGDVYTVLPFSGTVVSMKLTGEELASVLQKSAELPDGSGGKLQTYGIDYALENGKVRILTVGGKTYEPGQTYSLATNDFLAAGGDGYSILKNNGKNCYSSGKLIADLLLGFITEKQVITQQVLDDIK